MIRLTHLITTLNIGGSEMMLYRLLRRLESPRMRNRVISLVPPGPVGEMIADLGIPVTTLNMQHGQPSPGALLRLVRLLRAEKPDFLQTWLYHADLMGLLAGKIAAVPRVFWNVRSSDMDMSRYRRLSALTVRACAALSPLPDAVVVNSQAGQDYHIRIGYRPRRWVLIPNGVDTDRFRPDPDARQQERAALAVSPDVFVIGYVARFDPMKDHATFLRAARRLVDEKVGVLFVLCGPGMTWENGELVAMIDGLDLRPWLRLLGPRSDVERVFAALDLATSSSRSEGFPNTLAEAMACGLPCVATDAGDSARILGEAGEIVPVGDADALATAWRRMLSLPPAARRRLGESARRRLLERYSLERMVAAYQALYRGRGNAV